MPAGSEKPYKRLQSSARAKEVRRLELQGFTRAEIAQRLRVSERRVYQLLKESSADGDVYLEVPDPLSIADVAPEYQEMLQPSAEAFEKFFNEFSGKKLAPIHREWVELALTARRVLVNCPPRHAKSTIFSVWFPIWLVCRDRNVQILIVSKTDALAKKFTREVEWHLSSNPKLISAFGRFQPDDEKWPWRPGSGELMVAGRTRGTESGDMTIQVRGSGQQIIGMESDWIICDDPDDKQTAASERRREARRDWFHGEVMTRLEPDSTCFVIGQRVHVQDLYGHLAAQRLTKVPGQPHYWKHLNYPAVLRWPDQDPDNPEPEVLWPEKWTFEALMESYEDVGGHAIFEAMYQQNPLPEGMALVRREWIYGSDVHPGCLDLYRSSGTPLPVEERTVRVVSLDPSPTQYAGLVVADVWRDEHQVFHCAIIELVREKMAVRDMLRHIYRVLDEYQPEYFIFEQAAAQRWFLQDPSVAAIRSRVRILPHNTGRNKGDPVLGVESLALDFEFGRIRFPSGDTQSKRMSDLLINEALTWPQGETDDLLMALWFIKFNISSLVPRTEATINWYGGVQSRVPPRLKEGFWWAGRNKSGRP